MERKYIEMMARKIIPDSLVNIGPEEKVRADWESIRHQIVKSLSFISLEERREIQLEPLKWMETWLEKYGVEHEIDVDKIMDWVVSQVVTD